MNIVGCLGMCGNIRYRGINLSIFQCPLLQFRFLIYEEMLNLSTLYRIFGFLWGQVEIAISFLYITYYINSIIVYLISDTYSTV